MHSHSFTRFLIVAALAIGGTLGTASATPVLFGGTGHYYEHINGNLNWADARADALSRSHLFQQGYLATVTSAAENDFLLTLASGENWLGGSDQDLEGTWRWVDGPEAGTIFWLGVCAAEGPGLGG